MSDLLDSVRAVNPVPTCGQPALESVWRKLAQDEADASARARVVARARKPRRGVIAVSVMAAVVAAAVVAIATGRQLGIVGGGSPRLAGASAAVRRLAEGTISCDFASGGSSGRPAVTVVAARGRSALVFCRGRYRMMGPAGATASQMTLIACQTSATNVAVYVADGRPRQCDRLGDRPLPAGYAAAVHASGARAGTVSGSNRADALSV